MVDSYRSLVLAGAPRRYYRMADAVGSTVMVDTSGNSDGTYRAGGQQGWQGLLGGSTDWAYDPNGAGGGTAAIISGIVSSFSVECWIKPRSLANAQLVGHNGPSPNFAQTFVLNLGGYAGGGPGKLAFGQGIQASGFSALFGPVLEIGKVYYIAGTFQTVSNLWILYVNGYEFSRRTTAAPPPYNQSGQKVYIGFDGSGTGTGFFNGIIDEVAIYNTVLTPANIQARWGIGAQKGGEGFFM